MVGRPAQVARGLNTIASRIAKNTDVLAKYGIQVTDTNGNLKSTYDVLAELKPKWDAMSDAERVALGDTLAGVNQYKVLAAVMGNFNTAVEATNTALNSLGSAERENAAYMESLEAQTNNLKATFQELANNVISKELISSVLELANKALNGLNTEVGSAVIQWGLLSGVLIGVVTIGGAIIAKLGAMFATLTIGGVALSSILSVAAPVALGLAGVAVAAYKIKQAYDESHPSAETLKEDFENVKSEIAELTKDGGEYDTLKSKEGELTEWEQKRLEVLEKQLAALQQQANTKENDWLDKFLKDDNAVNIVVTESVKIDPSATYRQDPALAFESSGYTTQTHTISAATQSFDELNKAIIKLNVSYEEGYINQSDYLSSLSDLVSENKEYYDKLIQAKAAHKELSSTQENFIQIYESVVRVLTAYNAMLETNKQDTDEAGESAKTFAMSADIMKAGAKACSDALSDFSSYGDLTTETIKALKENLPQLADALFDEEGNLTDVGKAALKSKDALKELAVNTALQASTINGMNLSQAVAEIGRLKTAAEETTSVFGKMVYLQAAASLEGDINRVQDFISQLFNNVSSSSSGGSKSSTDTQLEAHKEVVSTLKSELTLMQNQGASIADQIAQYKKIQSALHDQAEYMRSIGSNQSEINALSNEWYEIQKNIIALQKTQLTTQQSELEKIASYAASAIQSQIDALDEANDALEEQLELEEKLKALQEAQENKKLVYKDGRFQYVDDIDAIATAQADLEETRRKQSLSSQKKALEEEKKLWTDYASTYEQAEGKIAYAAKYGTDILKENLDARLKNAREFVEEYKALMEELAKLENGAVSYTGGSGTSVSGITVSGLTNAQKLAQMEANSVAWHSASPAEKEALHAENMKLAAELGGLTYNSGSGTYSQNANGTLSAQGGLSLVGERGAEMRVLNQGDGIIPADITKNLWSWGSMTPDTFLQSLNYNPANGNQIIEINGNLTLPNVRNAETFLTGIKELAMQYSTKR